MDTSTVQLQRDEEAIECWDDDGDLQIDDVQLCAGSTASSVANSSFRRSGHRDSISSRRSTRSELDSLTGTDDDWQVMLHGDDEFATEEVLSSARNAGVPIPENIPKSALTGGTIKRLGRKKTTDFVHDWAEDLVFPGPEKKLELQMSEERTFPDAFPDLLPSLDSPEKGLVKNSSSPSFWGDDDGGRPKPADALDKFHEDEDESSFQDVPTIKVAKHGSPSKLAASSAASSAATVLSPDMDDELEDFENDFELPTDRLPLQLASAKRMPENRSPSNEDLDMDYSEGSIGVRFGGTTRESIPNSSISIFSPSASSCVTGEGEDDGLDGLVIPEGPLDLEASLKRQQDNGGPAESEAPPSPSKHAEDTQPSAEGDDFFSGLEIGDVDVSGPRKLAVNPNVKCKTEHRTGPAHRSSASITFVDPSKTRAQRQSGQDRSHGTQLETVSESGVPISSFRRPDSRIGAQSAYPSTSSFSPAPTTVAAAQQPRQSTAGRHEYGGSTPSGGGVQLL